MNSDITKHERLVEKKNNNISDVTTVDDRYSEAKSLADKKFNSENSLLAAGYPFFEYTLISQLNVASGEADLWVVAKEGREYILKLYRYGIKPKEEIWHKLKSLDRRHVVGTIEQGSFGNRYYEVLEKMNGGDLRSVKKPCTDEYLKLIVSELFASVSYLHEKGIIHRDLKPANILIRSNDPLELVIADFGIASLSEGNNDLKLTSTNRTVSYSAPEALAGVVSNMSDWWSIGVIVLEYLTGVHPFHGLSEKEINLQLVMKGIILSNNLKSEWGELLEGLLTRDYHKRWSSNQIQEWLKGKRNQNRYYDYEIENIYKYKPYIFNGKKLYTVDELAFELTNDWNSGIKHLNRGLIKKWITEELNNQDLQVKFDDLYDEKEKYTGDEVLSLAISYLNPKMPAAWMGFIVNELSAKRFPEEFYLLTKSKILSKLENLPEWPSSLINKLNLINASNLNQKYKKILEQSLLNGNTINIDGVILEEYSLFESKCNFDYKYILESEFPELCNNILGIQWLINAKIKYFYLIKYEAYSSVFNKWICLNENSIIIENIIVEQNNIKSLIYLVTFKNLILKLPIEFWCETLNYKWLKEIIIRWRIVESYKLSEEWLKRWIISKELILEKDDLLSNSKLELNANYLYDNFQEIAQNIFNSKLPEFVEEHFCSDWLVKCKIRWIKRLEWSETAEENEFKNRCANWLNFWICTNNSYLYEFKTEINLDYFKNNPNLLIIILKSNFINFCNHNIHLDWLNTVYHRWNKCSYLNDNEVVYLVTWLLDGTNAMSDRYGKIIDGNWINHNFKDFEYIISTNLPSFCKNILNNNYFNLVNERYLKIKEYLDFDIECNFLISWITFDDKFDQADTILDQNWYLSKFEIGTNLLQTDFSDFCFIELGISWLQEAKLRLAKSLNYNLHLKYLWLWIIKGIPSLVDSDSGLEITITWLENNSDLAHIFCEPNFAEFWDKNANSNWLLITALKWRKAILFNNSSQNLIYSNYIKKWVFNIDININILTQDLDNYIVNLGSDKYLEFIKSSMPIFWKENVGNEKFYNIQKKWIEIWDLAYSIIRQLRTINYELSEYEAYRLYFSGEDKLRYDSEELIKSHAPIDNNLLNSIWKRRKSLSIAEMIVVCSLYAPLIEKRKNKTITIIFKLIIIFVLIAIIYLIFKEYSLTKKYLINSSEINKNLNSQYSDKQNRVSSHIKELENKLNDLNKNPNNLSEREYENTLKYQNELKRLEDLSSKKIAANINSENINVYLDQAKQGSMFAEFQLAEYYSNYNDYNLATNWYKKSADQGYADAQYALAELYSNGFVVGHSLITAFELYKKAAEQGHLESIYKVAQCYQNGVGVITNFSEAVQWYTLASERGHVASMYNLGILYERGLGVDKNLNDAIKLYKSAALLNYKPAMVKLKDLNIPTNDATEGTPN